jgi:hypothetical protein
MSTNPKGRALIMRGESGPAGAEQRLKELGASRAIRYLRGSGTVGQSAFSERHASHRRPPREIHWAGRCGTRCGSWTQGGSPRGAQCSRCRSAAFGIARQSQARRSPRSIGGHFGRCPRTAESRGRCFGVAARRLRKGQESLSPGVWSRKPSARHPGRVGSDL